MGAMFSELEKKIIGAVQGDMPVVARPYLAIAERIGASEAQVLAVLEALCATGVIRRFGATLRHQKSGYAANAMTAWQVSEERIDEVGEKMAAFRQVSHCYRRNPTPEWPYNLYTMIHAKDEEGCREIARKMSEAASVDTYKLLFSRKELKKISMSYFPSNPCK